MKEMERKERERREKTKDGNRMESQQKPPTQITNKLGFQRSIRRLETVLYLAILCLYLSFYCSIQIKCATWIVCWPASTSHLLTTKSPYNSDAFRCSHVPLLYRLSLSFFFSVVFFCSSDSVSIMVFISQD